MELSVKYESHPSFQSVFIVLIIINIWEHEGSQKNTIPNMLVLCMLYIHFNNITVPAPVSLLLISSLWILQMHCKIQVTLITYITCWSMHVHTKHPRVCINLVCAAPILYTVMWYVKRQTWSPVSCVLYSLEDQVAVDEHIDKIDPCPLKKSRYAYSTSQNSLSYLANDACKCICRYTDFQFQTENWKSFHFTLLFNTDAFFEIRKTVQVQ